MCKKILIVDDDSHFISQILNRYSEKHYCFAIADSLERASEMIKQGSFDVILANATVPGGFSINLRKQLQTANSNAHLVFMSGIEKHYDEIINNGEKCYHKYDINQTFSTLLGLA
jgi:two-component SAPR family response regulator